MILMQSSRAALPLLAGALALSACSGTAETPHEGPSTVAVGFYALEFAVHQAADEAVEVVNLTASGVDPHDAELSPQLVATMSGADLVVHLSGFQPSVDQAIEQSGADQVLDVADVIELREIGGDDHGHDHDEHDHGPQDPHFWTDPILMAEVTTAIAEKMAELDPDSADAYESNAREADATYRELDEQYFTGLADCQRREFIPQHAAFGYMADRYDLVQISVAGLAPDEEPSPARIAEIQAEASAHGITTIFFEPGYPDAIARSIAHDLGLETATLDTVEGLTPESAGQDYVSIMQANLEALRSANGCN